MKPEAWHNAVGNLRSVLRDLGSQDVADQLRIGLVDGWVGASDLVDYFEHMYDILVPGELPSDIEKRLRSLHASLQSAVPPWRRAPNDADVVISRTWKAIQNEARELDDALRLLHRNYGQL